MTIPSIKDKDNNEYSSFTHFSEGGGWERYLREFVFQLMKR